MTVIIVIAVMVMITIGMIGRIVAVIAIIPWVIKTVITVITPAPWVIVITAPDSVRAIIRPVGGRIERPVIEWRYIYRAAGDGYLIVAILKIDTGVSGVLHTFCEQVAFRLDAAYQIGIGIIFLCQGIIITFLFLIAVNFGGGRYCFFDLIRFGIVVNVIVIILRYCRKCDNKCC
jgi:hypothetical protein